MKRCLCQISFVLLYRLYMYINYLCIKVSQTYMKYLKQSNFVLWDFQEELLTLLNLKLYRARNIVGICPFCASQIVACTLRLTVGSLVH